MMHHLAIWLINLEISVVATVPREIFCPNGLQRYRGAMTISGAASKPR